MYIWRYRCLAAVCLVLGNQAHAASVSSAPVEAKDIIESSPRLHSEEAFTKAKVDPISVPSSTKKIKHKSSARFVLRTAAIVGNTVLSENLLKKEISAFIGKKVTQRQLEQIADRITKLYHQAGYVTSRCFMPTQKVKNGRVVFQVEEGRLEDLIFKGPQNFDFDKRFFMQFISDLKDQVIHLPTLEQRMQRLVRLPAQQIQPKLVKVDFARYNLELTIQPQADFYEVSVNNMGSRYTGREQLRLLTQWYNLSGRLDRLQLSTQVAQNPKNFSFAQINYAMPVGAKSGILQWNASQLDYQLDPKALGYSAVRYEGSSITYGLQYTHPLLIEEKVNQWLNKLSQREKPLPFEAAALIGFEVKETTSDTLYHNFNNPLFPAGYRTVQGKDKLVVPMIGVQFQHPDHLFSLMALNRYHIKFIHSWEGFLGSMTQEEIERKQENVANNAEPIQGPIGEVQGMKASFYKLYFHYLRMQSLPKDFQLSVSFLLDYTPVKSVPSDYKYVPAGGGAKGYTLNIGVNRKVASDWLLGGGLISDNAIRYYQGTTVVCGKTRTVNGEVTCSDERTYLTLQYHKKGWFFSAEYFSSVQSYDSNGLDFRVNLGYRW